eukprot:TRINITY_DN1685_c0_g1_i4.p1 TRINITY_DN1685_c0_g1~~TRINITY_DN1685_c0_g1_i4.p1  ORF type:complete len:506 (+),score=71.59 TRINITY_DN1685_c0_g1_i4:412-1929(+)
MVESTHLSHSTSLPNGQLGSQPPLKLDTRIQLSHHRFTNSDPTSRCEIRLVVFPSVWKQIVRNWVVWRCLRFDSSTEAEYHQSIGSHFKRRVFFLPESAECSERGCDWDCRFFSDQNDTVTDMNCCGDDCNVGLNVVGCMIKYEDGQQLIQLLQQKVVTVEYFDEISRGFYFSIDPLSKIREVGWLKFPSFQFFSWEAVWENYLTGLRSQLSASDTVISLFTEVPLGGTPITVSVELPDLSKFSELKIELELGCIGRLDTDCPIWDRLLSLTVCCGDPEEKECWNELGRWVTPFRRQVGHWLTDVTPLTPLLTSDTCHFNLSTDPWIIKPWLPTLNLRLSKGSDPVRPVNILPLFTGGVFNQSYNDAYIPRNFSVPAGTKKVEIVAVITGHGSDSENCGEFCPSSHHFIVNGNPHVLTFSTAGTATGCADVVNLGGVPNEHGTWLYGRGGWCDGRDVAPWVVDITSELSENNNTITYFGWLNGAPPNPSSGFSVIDMTSHLVFWQ